jgi:hypothetical protein
VTQPQHGAPWLLVVGVHRSGTSAVTGALGALGFTVPRVEDRMEWLESNPEHWESLSLSVFNEDLLERLGGRWDAPPDLADDWTDSPALNDVRDPTGRLAAAFAPGGPSVWKDPRVCLLLDYWRPRLTGPLAAILVWRSPLAVARSLARRNSFALTDGLALWERYNRAALAGLKGVDTYVVSYESIVADPGSFVAGAATWLGSLDQFAHAAPGWDTAAAVRSVDGDLVHQTGAPDDQADVVLNDAQQQLVAHLDALSGGHRPFNSGSPIPESAITTAVVRLRRQLAAVEGDLATRSTRLALAEARFESARQDLEVARKELAALRQDLAEAGAEIDRVNARLALAEADRDRAIAIITNMRQSTSWKMTRAVRSVGSLRNRPADGDDPPV